MQRAEEMRKTRFAALARSKPSAVQDYVIGARVLTGLSAPRGAIMDAAAARSLSLRRGLSGIGQIAIAKARRGAAIIMANRVAAQLKK